MAIPTVLIVDPDDTRFLLEKEITTRFVADVVSLEQSQLAIALFRSDSPWFLLASARQNRHDGFKLCGALRLLSGSRKCTMIVYGGKLDDDRSRKQAEKQGVNAWLPGTDVEMLANLLEGKLQRRSSTTATSEFSRRFETFTATRDPDADKAESDAREEEPSLPPSEKDWADLLRSPATTASVKELLTRPIHLGGDPPDVEALECPDDVTWTELLRSEVSPATMRVLFSKEIALRAARNEAKGVED